MQTSIATLQKSEFKLWAWSTEKRLQQYRRTRTKQPITKAKCSFGVIFSNCGFLWRSSLYLRSFGWDYTRANPVLTVDRKIVGVSNVEYNTMPHYSLKLQNVYEMYMMKRIWWGAFDDIYAVWCDVYDAMYIMRFVYRPIARDRIRNATAEPQFHFPNDCLELFSASAAKAICGWLTTSTAETDRPI